MIGPKTNSVEKINELRKAGLNVVRMNFSHGSYEVGHIYAFLAVANLISSITNLSSTILAKLKESSQVAQ
jgi:pyruvate kinase